MQTCTPQEGVLKTVEGHIQYNQHLSKNGDPRLYQDHLLLLLDGPDRIDFCTRFAKRITNPKHLYLERYGEDAREDFIKYRNFMIGIENVLIAKGFPTWTHIRRETMGKILPMMCKQFKCSLVQAYVAFHTWHINAQKRRRTHADKKARLKVTARARAHTRT